MHDGSLVPDRPLGCAGGRNGRSRQDQRWSAQSGVLQISQTPTGLLMLMEGIWRGILKVSSHKADRPFWSENPFFLRTSLHLLPLSPLPLLSTPCISPSPGSDANRPSIHITHILLLSWSFILFVSFFSLILISISISSPPSLPPPLTTKPVLAAGFPTTNAWTVLDAYVGLAQTL